MPIINIVMKKFLPTSHSLSVNKSSKGFTLVELMVVITIIAILSIVGVTVYSSVQTKAQDSKRIQDIDAIASAMEVNFGKTNAGKYDTYVGQVTWFASGVPADPLGTANPYDLTDAAGGGFTSGSSTSFKVCATLKATTGKYCKSSQQ